LEKHDAGAPIFLSRRAFFRKKVERNTFLPGKFLPKSRPHTRDNSAASKIFNVIWTSKKTAYQRRRRKHVVYAESTLKKIAARLRMLSRVVDLDKPEQTCMYVYVLKFTGA